MIGAKLLEGRSQRERALILGGGALGVLLLAFLLLKVVGGGGGEALDTPLPPVVRRTPTPTATPPRSPLPVTGGAFGRDPFQPLVTDQPADGGGGGGTPAPSPGPNGGGTSSRRVTLVDVFRSGGELQATVSVDGTEYTVAEGETFDTNFRLQSLTTRCGTFLFGDERFTLCLGQQVNK